MHPLFSLTPVTNPTADTSEDEAEIEVSITADQDNIDRARTRAAILSAITEGAVTLVAITSRLNPAQSAQAEAAGVTTFVMPIPEPGPDHRITHSSRTPEPEPSAPKGPI